jgi:hypothetical protein
MLASVALPAIVQSIDIKFNNQQIECFGKRIKHLHYGKRKTEEKNEQRWLLFAKPRTQKTIIVDIIQFSPWTWRQRHFWRDHQQNPRMSEWKFIWLPTSTSLF